MLYNHDNYTLAQHILKRIADITLATLLLLLSLPFVVIPVIWLLLHRRAMPILSPVVYIGLGGKPFRSYRLCAAPSSTASPSVSSSPSPAMVALLSLPLLASVVRGDISLTGPTLFTQSELIPLMSSHPDISVLMGVKPGLVSSSQTYLVSAVGQTDIRQQIDIDIRYIESRTLLVDIQMLADRFLSLSSMRA